MHQFRVMIMFKIVIWSTDIFQINLPGSTTQHTHRQTNRQTDTHTHTHTHTHTQQHGIKHTFYLMHTLYLTSSILELCSYSSPSHWLHSISAVAIETAVIIFMLLIHSESALCTKLKIISAIGPFLTHLSIWPRKFQFGKTYTSNGKANNTLK